MKLFIFLTYISLCFACHTKRSDSTDKVILLSDSVFRSLSSALKAPEDVRELTIFVEEEDPNYIESLAKFPNMRKLVLSGEINNLDSVFKELQKVEGLEELEIKEAGIKKIPKSVSSLRKLKILRFRENEIESISNEIKELTQLEILDLSWNKLISIDSLINCMRGIKSLKKLSLYKNNIKSINANMCHLYSLKILNIEKNKLTTLPGEIACLTNLEEMYIGGNEINDIEKKRIMTLLPKCDIKFELFLE